MSRKLSAGAPSPSVASGKVPAPVRARLRRVNCDQAIPYESRMVAATEECLRYCLERIRRSLVQQLIAAARLPNSGLCEALIGNVISER